MALQRILRLPQLFSDGFGKSQDAGLGCGITALSRISADPYDRAHIDDRAFFGFHHGPDDLLGHIEDAFQVDIHYFVPLFGGHPEQEIVLGDTGIVHADVYGAELLHYFIHQGSHSA